MHHNLTGQTRASRSTTEQQQVCYSTPGLWTCAFSLPPIVNMSTMGVFVISKVV